MLGGLAEFERDLIRARTSEGATCQSARCKGGPPSQVDEFFRFAWIRTVSAIRRLTCAAENGPPSPSYVPPPLPVPMFVSNVRPSPHSDFRQRHQSRMAARIALFHFIEGKDGNDNFWLKIGAEHKDGDGISLDFEVFPTKTGRVTLRRMKDDED